MGYIAFSVNHTHLSVLGSLLFNKFLLKITNSFLAAWRISEFCGHPVKNENKRLINENLTYTFYYFQVQVLCILGPLIWKCHTRLSINFIHFLYLNSLKRKWLVMADCLILLKMTVDRYHLMKPLLSMTLWMLPDRQPYSLIHSFFFSLFNKC